MTEALCAAASGRRVGRPRKPVRLFDDLSLGYRTRIAYENLKVSDNQWPALRYRNKPVAFFREVLGVEPWAKQIEVIEAARDHKRVAISSGHKVSKSHTAAGLALWFYATHEDARVVMTSTTSRQVDQILWRELRMMITRSGRCVDCKRNDPKGPRPCPHSRVIPEIPFELARSGLKSPDFREIVGFTAKEAEAVAGISGKNLLYIADEASGIDDVIFEAIEGNRAGGARIVMFSNPTRTEGEFFAAFHEKSAFYKTIQISSEDSPNVREGREVIPGLATREWVEEKKQEWGEHSPLFKVRVKGEFVLSEDGKILSVHAIAQAESRWESAPDVGRLQIGLDPAGPGMAGDETAMASRRGAKVLGIYASRGLSEQGIVARVLGLAQELKKPGEVPLVVVDREGPIGNAVFGLLLAQQESNPRAFEVAAVRSSDKAIRNPGIYDRIRDELWAALAEWIQGGGAIPEDTKLAKELHAPRWIGHISGRLKCTPKDDLRKFLGRSPDRADAVALAVWEPRAFVVAETTDEERGMRSDISPGGPALDPFQALDVWGRG